MARAENLSYYNPRATVAEVAATLGWGLIKNHAFIDGNKRVGAISLITLLDANGYRLTCSEAEETAVVLGVAASEMTEEEWTEWVMRSVAAV